MDWIEKFLERNGEEDALYAEMDKLTEERENSPETIAYRKKISDLMEQIKELARKRREELRKERRMPEKVAMDEDAKKKLREQIKKKKE